MSVLGLAVCLLGITAGPARGASVPVRVQVTQRLAQLLSDQAARSAPTASSRQVAFVQARRPITGERTTLPVIGRSTAPGAKIWLKVMLPGRPNGSTGWIAQAGTRRLVTAWRILVDLRARRLTVYRGGRKVSTIQAVVGKPSTPTPKGRFFVEETVQMAPGEADGPFALALSARSNVLQEFEGGPGQIGIHGRVGLGGALGRAESHGCVRLATKSIVWLAAHIGPGTPVRIFDPGSVPRRHPSSVFVREVARSRHSARH